VSAGGPWPRRRAPGTGPAADSASRTAGALSSPEAMIHTSLAAVIAGRVRVSRVGGGLGAPRTGHDGPFLLIDGGHAGEQRRDVPLGADAQQQHVE